MVACWNYGSVGLSSHRIAKLRAIALLALAPCLYSITG